LEPRKPAAPVMRIAFDIFNKRSSVNAGFGRSRALPI